MKNFILILSTIISIFFIAEKAGATCSNYTTYADGQVLTAGSLNSLQTNYTNCINAVLDGDIFTGDINLYSGADLIAYTDTGSTKTIHLDTATGDILGAPRQHGAYGLSLAGPTAGVVTIQCRNATCSSSNPAYVVMNSTTAGQQVTLKVTSGGTFTDDSGTSDLTNWGLEIDEAAHWAQDVPFFLYVVNRGNSNLDGADGSSMFFFSRLPNLTTTPSAAGYIGDTGAIPVSDTQDSILILADVTVANYTSLPVELIGSFRMQWSTTTDDWTVQTLGQTDGISESALEKTFSTYWTMPTGQNGAASGSYLFNESGTEPVFTGNSVMYRVSRSGIIDFSIYLSGDGGTDGSGAGEITISMPFLIKDTEPYSDPTLVYVTLPSAVYTNAVGFFGLNSYEFYIKHQDLSGTSLINTGYDSFLNSDFSNGTRNIIAHGKLFPYRYW